MRKPADVLNIIPFLQSIDLLYLYDVYIMMSPSQLWAKRHTFFSCLLFSTFYTLW